MLIIFPISVLDIQVVIRPGEITEAFEVYIKYGERPNITHNDFMDSVPKADLSHLKQESSLDTLGPEIQGEFLYTVSVPRYLTTENGTYWVGIKLKSKFRLTNHSRSILIVVNACTRTLKIISEMKMFYLYL